MEGNHLEHRGQEHDIGEGEMNNQVIGRERRAEQVKETFGPTRPGCRGEGRHGDARGRDSFEPMNIGSDPQAQQLG